MLNIDETSWKTFNFGELTWAAKGAEHVEFANVWNDKECITALAAITADPELTRLPLCIIRKGKTNQSKKVFSDCDEYFQLFITENGWSTSECFAQYLIWLRAELNERYKDKENFTEDTEIDLILDLYASHATEELKQIAKLLHFNLIYIPAGATDTFQPLDRYVFGALKNMAKAIFYQLYAQNPSLNFTMNDAVKVLVSCWSDLTNKTIAKAWDLYSDPDEDYYDKLVRTNKFDMEFSTDILTLNPIYQSNFLKISFNSPSQNGDEEISALDAIKEAKHAQQEQTESEETNKPDQEEPRVEEHYLESDDEDCDCDSYLPINELPPSIQDKIRVDCENELLYFNSERKSYTNGRIPIQFVGIENTDNTCYINTTIQVLSSIPGLRGMLPAFCISNEDAITLHHDVMGILDTYDNSKYQTMQPLPELSSFNFDVKTNIEVVCEPFNFGITLKNEGIDVHQLFLYIVNDDGDDKLPPCEEILKMFVNDHEFCINTIIGFEKGVSIPYEFPSSFWYGSYFLIAKAFVSNIDNYHYYCYIRDRFTPNFYRINDNNIERVDWYDVAADETISFAIYLVYDKEEVPEIDKEAIDYFTESTIENDERKNTEEIIDLQQLCPDINELIIKMKEKPKKKNAYNPSTKKKPHKKYTSSLLGWNSNAASIAPLKKYQFK